MSNPVQFSVVMPMVIGGVQIVPPVAHPVAIPATDPAELQISEAGSVEVKFPNFAPAQILILPASGPAGQNGTIGANAQTVVLTLAAYLALSPAEQMNGTWYAIPKA